MKASWSRSPYFYALRFLVLLPLYIVLFVIGTMPLGRVMPADGMSEPGLMSPTGGLVVMALVQVLVIYSLILTSRWHGWKLAIGLAFVYYGVVTFLMQVETWYFLSDVTVGPDLLPYLFFMGIPPAFVFIPIAVFVLGQGRPAYASSTRPPVEMPASQWILKLAVLAVSYLVFYWLAGYFIAWQNPELRAFYGQPGDPLPFLAHTAVTLREDPMLFPFQLLRGLIWALCAVFIIRGSAVSPWWTALLVGSLFSLPQNIGHVLANPFIPYASVRLSHLIETASSTFLFGVMVVWLLHRRHRSASDLLNLHRSRRDPAQVAP